MKKITCTLMAVFVVLLTGVADAAEPIRIGVAGAHSGDLASYRPLLPCSLPWMR